jgi:hypothetical protein
MGGAKRYPSILVAKMMGFAKGSTHPTRSAVVKGPYIAETLSVSVESDYVVVDL